MRATLCDSLLHWYCQLVYKDMHTDNISWRKDLFHLLHFYTFYRIWMFDVLLGCHLYYLPSRVGTKLVKNNGTVPHSQRISSTEDAPPPPPPIKCNWHIPLQLGLNHTSFLAKSYACSFVFSRPLHWSHHICGYLLKPTTVYRKQKHLQRTGTGNASCMFLLIIISKKCFPEVW